MSLVREGGTKVNVHRDRQRSQDVARDLELGYRLQLTTSRIAASAERGERPSERSIAERAGAAETKARRLERGVRAAAGASETEGEFVRRLHQYGIIAKPRLAAGQQDVVTGYSVALLPQNREPIVWHGGGRLARDPTLQRLREGWPDTPTGATETAAEWQATWRNPIKYKPVQPGREQHAPAPELWQQVSTVVQAPREQSRSIPKDDRATWAIVSKETSAGFAAWSERIEPTPGPLADSARVLARGAQIWKDQVRPKRAGMVSASGAAMLLAAATKGGQVLSLRPCCSVSSSSPPGHCSTRTRPCASHARHPRSRTPSARSSTPSARASRRSRRLRRRPRTLLQQHPRRRCRLTHALRKHGASSTRSAAPRAPARRARSGSSRRSLQRWPSAQNATDTRDRETDE